MNYNKVILVGRLTRDPELKYTNTGIPVAKYGLAVNRNFKNAQGIYETDFFDIVSWRKLAEISAKFLKKGRLVILEGRLQTRKYQAQDGSTRTGFDIQAEQMQMLETKSAKDDVSFTNSPPPPPGSSSYHSGPGYEDVQHTDKSAGSDDFNGKGMDDIDFEDVPF